MAIECTYCEEKVNAKRGVYVKCTTCTEILLCLECFSAGAVIDNHESDHPYELIDCGSFPIIDESWLAYEDLALLEAIELYGIGSWTDIAIAVETRSADECCNRYLSVHVDNFFGRCSWNAIDKSAYRAQDHTFTRSQPLSPSLYLPEERKIVDISREQQIRLGYMPKRDDFEREYDNEAEFLVSKLAVNANDDTELDQDLKLAHINMYTDRLRKRFRRKRIVLEYNLVKLFFHMHPEENSDLLIDPQTRLTPASSDETTQNMIVNTVHDDAITSTRQTSNNNGDSKNLKSNPDSSNNTLQPNSTAHDKPSHQIQNTILNYFSRIEPASNGKNAISPSSKPFCKIEPTQDNDQEKKKGSSSKTEPNATSILSNYFSDLNKSMAEQDFNSMEKKLRIFCQFSSADDHNRLIRNLAREKELKVKVKELIKKRKNDLKLQQTNFVHANSNGLDSDTNSKHSPSNNKKNSKTMTNSASSTSVDDGLMDVDGMTLSPAKVTQKKNNTNNHKNNINNNLNGNNNNNSTKAIIDIALNQNSEPCWRLLSEGEKRLCKSSNLKPSQYISYKAFIIKEHNQKRKKGSAQRLFTGDIDKSVKKKIVHYLTRNNWIKV